MRKGIKLQLPPWIDIQQVVAFAKQHGCSVQSRGFYDFVMVPDKGTPEASRYERARISKAEAVGPETGSTEPEGMEPAGAEGDSPPPARPVGACGYCGQHFKADSVAVEHPFFGPIHWGCNVKSATPVFEDDMRRNF